MFIWNDEQERVIQNGVYHIKHGADVLYEFTGRAGTGKSTVLMEILRRSGIPMHRVAAMCYCGAPAVLLRLKGFLNAKTIHSWCYRPVEEIIMNSGQMQMDSYFDRPKTRIVFEPKPIEDVDLIFVDEAGQAGMDLAMELKTRGIKMIATGDLCQLPPVQSNPGFLLNPNLDQLVTPMRQSSDSAILYLADRAIRGLPIHTGFYGNVLVIERDELTDAMIKSSQVIICGTNAARDEMNKHVRHDILGFDSDLPKYGERIICRKNNWQTEADFISLSNGLVGTVINEPSVMTFKNNCVDIDFIADRTIVPFKDIKMNFEYLNASFKDRERIKNNRWSPGNFFEYAYAQTCHVCQGNEYDHGLILEEYMHPEIERQWMYTALTRFKKSCILVKRKKKFYY